jgi:hypothetical protein
MSEEEEAPIPLEGPEEELEALPLAAEEAPAAEKSSSKIRAFGSVAAPLAEQRKQFQRTPNLTGAGAVRCRMFNSKISVPALEHMVEKINEWLDSEEVEVKAVNQVVGVMEGKTPEPNLIVTVWY